MRHGFRIAFEADVREAEVVPAASWPDRSPGSAHRRRWPRADGCRTVRVVVRPRCRRGLSASGDPTAVSALAPYLVSAIEVAEVTLGDRHLSIGHRKRRVDGDRLLEQRDRLASRRRLLKTRGLRRRSGTLRSRSSSPRPRPRSASADAARAWAVSIAASARRPSNFVRMRLDRSSIIENNAEVLVPSTRSDEMMRPVLASCSAHVDANRVTRSHVAADYDVGRHRCVPRPR